MSDKQSIGVLILAAGGSSRLGRPKQLLELKGETLIRRTIKAASRNGFGAIIVVVGAYAKLISGNIEGMHVDICVNDQWQSGMSTSLKSGIQNIEEKYPEIDAVLILLSDQPFVSHKLINQLTKTFLHSRKEIIASKYEDTTGVPAIFPKAFFKELKLLKGDKGARKILTKYASQVKTVSFEKGNLDIDSPSDFNNLLKRLDEKKGELPEFD